MSGFERGFRKKTPSELRQQLKQTIAQLHQTKLALPSVEKDLVKQNEAEIKERHPRRYDMYLSLLRGRASNPSAWFGHHGQKGAVLGSIDIARMRKWLGALNNLDNYIEAHKSGESRTLRYNQPTVFEDMRDFVEKGGDAGYVKLPTGIGKTVLFAEFVEALDLRTLIVVPTKILVDQTEEKLQKFAPDLPVGVVRSGRKRDLGKQCTVLTTQSFTTKVNNGEINPGDYDVLILDEVHTALSDPRMHAVNQFTNTLKLGFTATPDYSPKKGVGKLLETQIHALSIKEAVVEEGALSGFQCILAKTDTDLSKVRIVGGEKYDEKELEQAVNNLIRNRSAVDLYKKMFKGHLAIAYCSGIQHATDLAKMFKENGVAAAVISGKTPENERTTMLRKYNAGEIKVLCNSDILIAGFDEPKASVCLNLRPTLSPVVAEQRGGRVLRLNDDDEEKVAYIVDFVDKGHDPKYYPILFADVAEEVALLRKGKLGLGRYKKLDVKVEGLDVETDPDKVKEIVKGIREGRRLPEKFLHWGDFVRVVRTSDDIKSESQYFQKYHLHKGWPSRPDQTYKEHWKGWRFLFGTEHREGGEILELDALQAEVRGIPIESQSHYVEYRKQYKKSRWPSTPQKYYGDEWPGWDVFLHKDVREFPAWNKFKKEVRDKKIRSKPHYKEVYREHRWPSNPDATYKHVWKSWADLLGK